MLRTVLAVLILCCSVLFAPVWVQVALFVVAVVLVPYRFALMVPAVLADVLYRPSDGWVISNFVMTIGALCILFLFWFFITRTRLASIIYGVEAR